MSALSFLNFLISGVSLGSIYAIIALGYTMVYGIAKMLNFAHGDVIMVGSRSLSPAKVRYQVQITIKEISHVCSQDRWPIKSGHAGNRLA